MSSDVDGNSSGDRHERPIQLLWPAGDLRPVLRGIRVLRPVLLRVLRVLRTRFAGRDHGRIGAATVLWAMTDPHTDRVERIWRELSNRLRRFVLSRIRSESDADDILQTVFLRLHERLESLRDVDRLESWIFQITRNAIVDHYRSARAMESEVDSAPVEENGRSLTHEVADCIRALIDTLPTAQRDPLALYELDGMSQQEIAERDATPLSSVKSRIQRGRRSIATVLRSCCELEFDRRGNVLHFDTGDDDDCDGCDC